MAKYIQEYNTVSAHTSGMYNANTKFPNTSIITTTGDVKFKNSLDQIVEDMTKFYQCPITVHSGGMIGRNEYNTDLYNSLYNNISLGKVIKINSDIYRFSCESIDDGLKIKDIDGGDYLFVLNNPLSETIYLTAGTMYADYNGSVTIELYQ